MRNPLFLLAAMLLYSASAAAAVEPLPATISDQEFWRLVTELSEPGGQFQLQFMSNEDSALFVIPTLKETTPKGGVYIGVGSEQNFTYIAAIQPKLAFIVDIRRDNMIEHLMYKALFELSRDRADFVSRLFARRRPAGLDANSPVSALFKAYESIEVDPAFYETNLNAVVDHLVNQHRFPLTDKDKADIARVMSAFRTAGPYTLKGTGDTTNPTYSQLMAATDLMNRQQSYLASEENFRIVQDLEQRNFVVPLVGDFAGDKAIKAIGQYLKERDAVVNVFYVSNVERYLFEQGAHGRQFYANLATLPVNGSSTFIRSLTSDISVRLSIPIPPANTKWRTMLYPINDCLKAFTEGRLETYRDLFVNPR